ncbi:MAG: polysaccharide biosynthesis protein [Brevinema sp.]
MKIVITASTTPILHGVTGSDLTRLMDSEGHLYFLTNPIEDDVRQYLNHNGVRVLELSDLVKKHAIAMPPSFSDIISREECPKYRQQLEECYTGKTILITGGEGYIGSALVKSLLELSVARVVVYGHGENSISQLLLQYKEDPRFSYILGDIRDEEKLYRSFEAVQPHIVFHAAAHKHVPILESFPEEAVKTNILGTYKTISAACQSKAERFILISTDKAVNPTSALGMSKRIAEKICLSMENETTSFASVRFGNVFGSTGSVIPTFLQQLSESQPLTLTDQNMMRYFMSVQEASRLVLLAGAVRSGSLFTLDMGAPVSMIELANRVFDYCGITKDQRAVKIIGNRGGEKFSEELIHSFESSQPSDFERLLILKDSGPRLDKKEILKMCAEFADAASFGSQQDVFMLFEKYISRYIGART